MSKKFTVNFSDDVLKKLIKLHSTRVGNSDTPYSFSKVVNEELRKGLMS